MAKKRVATPGHDIPASAQEPVAPQAYVAWKEAKIRAALAQSLDRTCMIPPDTVWQRFGFETEDVKPVVP
jgi:hypothetical protein